MKRLTLFLFCGLFLFTTINCSLINKSYLKLSEEYTQSTDTIRTISKEFLARWPLESGIIRGYFNDDLSSLPRKFEIAMDRLDALATECKNNPDISDKNLGYAYGFRLYWIIIGTLKKFAPDSLGVLNFI